ncbi:MAG TPA: hypothetical protein VGD43_17990 [Micromonospora sp.]
MTEILIPGEELDRLSRLLAAVHDCLGDLGVLDQLLDGDPGGSIGDPRLVHAVEVFHVACRAGHRRLREEVARLAAHAAEIVRVAHATDLDTANRIAREVSR